MKVNVVGALDRSKLKIPCNFQKHWEKQNKKDGQVGVVLLYSWSVGYKWVTTV